VDGRKVGKEKITLPPRRTHARRDGEPLPSSPGARSARPQPLLGSSSSESLDRPHAGLRLPVLNQGGVLICTGGHDSDVESLAAVSVPPGLLERIEDAWRSAARAASRDVLERDLRLGGGRLSCLRWGARRPGAARELGMQDEHALYDVLDSRTLPEYGSASKALRTFRRRLNPACWKSSVALTKYWRKWISSGARAAGTTIWTHSGDSRGRREAAGGHGCSVRCWPQDRTFTLMVPGPEGRTGRLEHVRTCLDAGCRSPISSRKMCLVADSNFRAELVGAGERPASCRKTRFQELARNRGTVDLDGRTARHADSGRPAPPDPPFRSRRR